MAKSKSARREEFGTLRGHGTVVPLSSYGAGGTSSQESNGTQSSMGTYGADTGNGLGSFHNTALNSFSSQGSTTFQETFTSTGGWNLYQAGSYALGSFGLSSAAYTETSAQSFSSQQVDAGVASGSDTFTSLGTSQQAGTTSYGGSILGGLGTLSGNQSSVDSYTQSFTQTLTQSAHSNATLTEQGSYGGFSFALTSVVYQANGDSAGTLLYSAGSSFGAAGSYSNQGTGTQSGIGTFGADTGTGLALGCTSATGTWSNLGSSTVEETATSSDCWSLYQAGSFAFASYALSSVAYSETFLHSDNVQRTDTGTQTGRDGYSSLATNVNNGTTAYGGWVQGGLGTVLSNASSTDSYTRTFTETLTQSSSSTYTLSQQGSFGTESYAFSSLVYQNSASARETFQYAASDAYSAGGGYSNVSNATQSSLGTAGASLACGTALGTTTASGNWSSQGTTTVHETVTDASGWSLYESGSFSLDSYTLGSMAYGESASSSFSFQQVDCSSATGNDTVTSLGTIQNTGTTTYGPWLLKGADTSTGSSTAVDSYTQSSTQMLTQSGGNSYSLSEQGGFSADSWALSSVLYQANGSWTQETDYAANNSVATAGTIINSQSGNQTNSYTDPALADSALGCYASTDTTNYATQDSVSVTETVTDSGGWSAFRAGNYAQGSFALASVAYSESYSQNYAFHEEDSGNASGAESCASNGTSQESATFADSSKVLNSLDTVSGDYGYSGSYTQAYSRSITQTGGATDSRSEQGVFSGGSLAFASVVYQSSANVSTTVEFTATANDSTGSTSNSAANGSQSSNDSYGTGSDTAVGSYTNSDQSSFTSRRSSTITETLTSGGGWNRYEAGSWANDSYALSSVAYSESFALSDAFQEIDSATLASGATVTAAGSYSIGDTATYGQGSSGDSATVFNSAAFTGTETVTSITTVTSDFSDSWSLSEEGSFAGGSYSLGTIIYQQQGSAGATAQFASTDCFVSGSTVASNGTTQEAGSESLGLTASGKQDNGWANNTVVQVFQSSREYAATEVSGSSYSLYEKGTESNGSYALSSISYEGGSNYSSSASDSLTATSSYTLLAASRDTGSSADTGNFGSTTDSGQASSTDSVSASYSAFNTTSYYYSATRSADSSFSEQGSFANGSYSLGSVVFNASDAGTYSSLETSVSSIAATGVGAGSGAGAHNSNATVTGAGATLVVSASGVTGQTGTLTFSFAETETWTRDHAGAYSDSLYQDGSFANGSYSLGSVAYDSSASDSVTTADALAYSQVGTAQVTNVHSAVKLSCSTEDLAEVTVSSCV